MAAVAIVSDGHEDEIHDVECALGEHAGVAIELLVIDARRFPADEPTGLPEFESRRVIAAPGVERGRAWRIGAEATQARGVVLLDTRAALLEGVLERALQRLDEDPELQAVSCDYELVDADGCVVDVSYPRAMGEAPGPGWLAGVVWRREALGAMGVACFHPVELEHYQRLRSLDCIAHVSEPGFQISLERYQHFFAASKQEAALLTLARAEAPARPQISVIVNGVATTARTARSIESLARQLAPRGIFELIVVDDRNDVERTTMLSRLELAIPFKRVFASGGAGEQLAAALAVAVAPVTLFLRAGCVAAPDLVEQHLLAHSRGSKNCAILGALERPRLDAELALPRHLSCSKRVVPRQELTRGEKVGGEWFETANVSVRREALHAVGGFDPLYRHRENGDIDLGLRLEASGVELIYRPSAMSSFAPELDLDALGDRRRGLWAERVRLFLRQPEALRRAGLLDQAASDVDVATEESNNLEHALLTAARELATMDVSALERLGPEFERVAEEVVQRLDHLLRNLEECWRLDGITAGLSARDCASLESLASSWQPRPDPQRRRILAWPSWNDPLALDRLFDCVEPLVDRDDVELVLRRDPTLDPSEACVEVSIALHVERRLGADVRLQVAVDGRELGSADWLGLCSSVDAVFEAVDGKRPENRKLDVRVLRSRDDVESFVGATDSAVAVEFFELEHGSPEPEISVVIPAFDRPRQILHLLKELAHQDLDPDRFEVCVVDDGSPEPIEPHVAPRTWPFRVHVLRQDHAGPAAARNRGIEMARAEIVLFLDDDVVPKSDCLRRHLDAHRHATERSMIQGAVTLQDMHRRHSLGDLLADSGLERRAQAFNRGQIYPGRSLSVCNASMSRELLTSVGGFDESFDLVGGEDAELGERLDRELGVRLRYLPEAEVEHDHEFDIWSFCQRQRVLGWAAYRIGHAHDDFSLDGPGGGSLSEAALEELESRLDGTEDEIVKLVERVDGLCNLEIDTDSGPQHRTEVDAAVARIATVEYGLGLLEAHAGAVPFAHYRSPAFATAAAGWSTGSEVDSNVQNALTSSAFTRLALTHSRELAASIAAESLEAQVPQRDETAERAQFLHELARRVDAGVAVLVGPLEAETAVALGCGSVDGHGQPVYVVCNQSLVRDDQRADLMQSLLETRCDAIVKLIELSPRSVASGFEEAIDLLVLSGGDAIESLELFHPYLAPAARVVVRGPSADFLRADDRFRESDSHGDLVVFDLLAVA